jgi:Asp-tRNA(Asn)/Glu-tRNA(Gln) amidotransferase B subunit
MLRAGRWQGSKDPRESLSASPRAQTFFTEAIYPREPSDTGELEPVVDAVLAANPGQVEAYRGGKEGLLGFFVGQVMKETGGKANPKVVNELLREKLKQ